MQINIKWCEEKHYGNTVYSILQQETHNKLTGIRKITTHIPWLGMIKLSPIIWELYQSYL